MDAGASLAVALVLVPLLGAVIAFLVPQLARALQLVVAVALPAGALALALLLDADGPLRYRIGGWSAPLGIDLHVDGLAAFLAAVTALTGAAVGLYGSRYFSFERGRAGGFAPLWLLLWAGLNALYLSGDVFNLYVTLEIVGLCAVVLVALAGGADALAGAMRYLLMTMFASLTYLLGVTLLYHQAGTLDIVLLGARLEPGAPAWIALSLMVVALMVKSALFPLHFWLPSAHASAPAPVSALLSALVVTASFYVLLRLWLDVMPDDRAALGLLLAALGAGGLVWGSIQALRQSEIKLLVAYSTVAQLGYLFLPFAIRDPEHAVTAWRGAMYFLLCHALAKSAMFMAVGNLVRLECGTGRIAELHQVALRRPMTLAAFGIAGITLIGLPPSGGFLAKWLLLEASVLAGEWWLAGVILAGGLLSAAYVFRVVGPAFVEDLQAEQRPSFHPLEWIALVVALGTVGLGFAAPLLLALLDAGAPFLAGDAGS